MNRVEMNLQLRKNKLIIKKVSDSFLTDEEIEIKKIYFNAVEQINIFQEPYFLYDRSKIIKKLLLTKSISFYPFIAR